MLQGIERPSDFFNPICVSGRLKDWVEILLVLYHIDPNTEDSDAPSSSEEEEISHDISVA